MAKRTTLGLKKTKVRRRLKQILAEHDADAAFEPVMKLIDEYDEGIIRRINKYRRLLHTKESAGLKEISEALYLTIEHHGPITHRWVPSATKRLFGYLYKRSAPVLRAIGGEWPVP